MATGSSGKIILMSLTGNSALTIAKFVIFAFTRSPSMLAEAIHSLGDSFNQFLIYIGFRQGRIGPCHRYPMGHGRAIYLFNILAASGISVGAIYTLYHGAHILITPPEMEKIALSYPSLLVLALAFVIEGVILYAAVRGVWEAKGEKPLMQYLKESDDPSLIAVLFEDGLAVIGAVLAFVGILIAYYTQSIIPDAVVALLIGLMLLLMSIYLFRLNYGLLVGSSLPPKEAELIKKFIEGQVEVDHIVHMATEILAPGKNRLSLEIEFLGHHIGNKDQIRRGLKKLEKTQKGAQVLMEARDQTVRNLGSMIDKLEDKIQLKFPNILIVDVEAN